MRGMAVGAGAYLDTVKLLDYELASFGEGVAGWSITCTQLPEQAPLAWLSCMLLA
jgi:hypothetical protein